MFSHHFYPTFSGDEQLMERVHWDWIVLLPSTLSMFFKLLLLIPVGMVLRFIPYGGSLFVAFVIVIGLQSFLKWFTVRLSKVFITNLRVISVLNVGIFHQKVIEVPLDKIENVTYEIRGFFKSLRNVGEIRIKSSTQDDELRFANIRNPQKLQSKILKLKRQCEKTTHSALTLDTMDQLIDAILKNSKKQQPEAYREIRR